MRRANAVRAACVLLEPLDDFDEAIGGCGGDAVEALVEGVKSLERVGERF